LPFVLSSRLLNRALTKKEKIYMTNFLRWLLTIFTLCLYVPALSAGQLQFVSTESDPDAFIQNSVNVT